MTNRKIKQTISEMLDYMYSQHNGIELWYDNLSYDEEASLDKDLFDIFKRRLDE